VCVAEEHEDSFALVRRAFFTRADHSERTFVTNFFHSCQDIFENACVLLATELTTDDSFDIFEGDPVWSAKINSVCDEGEQMPRVFSSFPNA
jgi:hypothetical protein